MSTLQACLAFFKQMILFNWSPFFEYSRVTGAREDYEAECLLDGDCL